jgi:hypothetical protein
MNRISRTAFAVLAALAVGAGDAAAQTVSSPFRYLDRKTSVEAFGGYLFTDAEVTIDTANVAEFGPRSAPVFGMRAARRLAGPLSAELMLGFSPSERKLIAAAEGQDSAFTGPLDTGSTVGAPLLMAEAGIRFHVTGDRTYRGFAPFILATGGLVADVGGGERGGRLAPRGRALRLRPRVCGGGRHRSGLVPERAPVAPRGGQLPVVADVGAPGVHLPPGWRIHRVERSGRAHPRRRLPLLNTTEG